MTAAVKQILNQIMKLPETDRRELMSELVRRDEREWQELLREVRPIAQQRGIDDEVIARAIEARRYGAGPSAR